MDDYENCFIKLFKSIFPPLFSYVLLTDFPPDLIAHYRNIFELIWQNLLFEHEVKRLRNIDVITLPRRTKPTRSIKKIPEQKQPPCDITTELVKFMSEPQKKIKVVSPALFAYLKHSIQD